MSTEGSRTHWLVVPLRVIVAGTAAPVAAFFSVKVVKSTPVMSLLKVAVRLDAGPMPLALAAGTTLTVGAGPVRKVHVVEASGLPAASRTAAGPPVSVAEYR